MPASVEEYAASQLSDGGFICKRLLAKKPTRKSCYKASLAALLLYAVCEQRSIHLPETDRLLEYFLKRDVFYRSADRTKLLLDGRPGWRSIDNFFPVEPMRIGLPLTMASLAILGAGSSPALAKGWSILAAKENENDHYVLEGTLTRQPCKFGKVGEENEWVTFYALLAGKYRNSAMGTGENDARV